MRTADGMTPPPVRVLVAIPTPQIFGLQKVTLAIFGRLRASVDAHFLVSRWGDGAFGREVRRLGFETTESWFGMFSRRLDWANLRMTAECLWRLPMLWVDTIRLARRCRPAALFVANYHELILLRPILRVLGMPVICHMHDPPPNIPFQRASFFLWGRAVTVFVAVSESVRDRLLRFKVDPRRVLVVNNGIDLTQFPRRESRTGRFTRRFKWPEDVFIAGIVGQMHDRKGHLDLLEALDRLRDRVPYLRVVIGGKAGGAYYEQLVACVSERGLKDRVGFCGWMDHARDFYEGIDAFVLASRHEEGFGLVLAEAMAVGVPVIATRSGGAVNVVEDGVSGLLVDRCAPEQIAEALQRLCGDAALRERLVAGGRARVETEFNLDRQAEKLLAVLQGTAARVRGSGC